MVAFLADAIGFYEQPGGIRVRLLWDAVDPDRFIEVIEYADQAAHDRDQHRVRHDPVMGEYLQRWRSLLDAPPHVETYRTDAPQG